MESYLPSITNNFHVNHYPTGYKLQTTGCFLQAPSYKPWILLTTYYLPLTFIGTPPWSSERWAAARTLRTRMPSLPSLRGAVLFSADLRKWRHIFLSGTSNTMFGAWTSPYLTLKPPPFTFFAPLSNILVCRPFPCRRRRPSSCYPRPSSSLSCGGQASLGECGP